MTTKKTVPDATMEGEVVVADASSAAVIPYDPKNISLTVNEVEKVGGIFYSSGVFTDIKSAAQAVVKIMAGQEMGLPPMYSMQNFYLVNGKIGTTSQLVAALIKRTMGRYDYRVVEWSDQQCSVMFYEEGKEVLKSTFSLDDARRAGLIKSGGAWEKYPRDLLFARALMQGARKAAPDVVMGLYTKEELDSIDPVPMAPRVHVTVETAPPVAESVSTGAPIVTHSNGAPVQELPPEAENWQYAPLAHGCTLHGGDEWRVSKFGKRYHMAGKDKFCNFRDVVSPIKETILKKIKMDEATLATRIKNLHGGKTWSQLTEADQLIILFTLDTMENPLTSNEASQPTLEG